MLSSPSFLLIFASSPLSSRAFDGKVFEIEDTHHRQHKRGIFSKRKLPIFMGVDIRLHVTEEERTIFLRRVLRVLRLVSFASSLVSCRLLMLEDVDMDRNGVAVKRCIIPNASKYRC